MSWWGNCCACTWVPAKTFELKKEKTKSRLHEFGSYIRRLWLIALNVRMRLVTAATYHQPRRFSFSSFKMLTDTSLLQKVLFCPKDTKIHTFPTSIMRTPLLCGHLVLSAQGVRIIEVGRTLVEQTFYRSLLYVSFRTLGRSQVRTNIQGSDCSCQQTARPSSDSDHQSEMVVHFPKGDVKNSVLNSYVRAKYINTQIRCGFFFSSKLFKKPHRYKHCKKGTKRKYI